MLIDKKGEALFSNYSSTLVSPKLIRLTPNLTVALFELMKLIPAKYTLLKALKEGKLNPDYPIIETSSGTYAQGLALVCRELDLPFIIISDPVIDPALQSRLVALGGKVQIIERSIDNLNIQTLRLQALRDYLFSHPQAFWPAQYDNPDNRHAYTPFADLLLENLRSPLTLIGAVGSGGSTCGTIERLREVNTDTRLIGVDTFGSVLFGLPAGKRKLRGLGNSLLPKNVIHSSFDEVHWVSAHCAYKALRELYSKTGLYCGPTTGAAFHVARWIANKNRDEEVVFIAPDSGHRYTHTVYSDRWIGEEGIDLNAPFPSPLHIDSLSEVGKEWAYFNWKRQPYEQVVNHHG
ncbi:pyridoxal-phosphate dependent enzyme [Candidatus Neptunochlamydia vexilliferae]|nr:pyridoxal-phosphate dependent enzyme [Candidatus Neptunochlamydia vexilliferae]